MPRQRRLEERRRAFFKPTERAAPEVIESEVEATRKKTAKLKTQRLAKEAREGITDLDKNIPKRR
jgi:hypothetical protein